jgi:enamine deaminase RidA (YjgF/YER057c/UK114 family)
MTRNNSPVPQQKGTLVHSVSSPLTVVQVQRDDLTEYFLTFRPEQPSARAVESVESIYNRVAEFLSEIRGEILQERCYAMTNTYPQVSAARQQAYEKHGVESEGSLCFVGEMPCEPTQNGVAGIQVWAVRTPKGGAVSPLMLKGQALGRKFCYGNVCYLSVASLGPAEHVCVGHRLHDHALSMFENANRVLEAHGLTYRDVARTWIYLPKLLSWYGEFNAARRQAYQQFGLMDGQKPVWLPASTGIQGDCPFGRECMMDFLAISRLGEAELEAKILNSPRQCEAFQYGSSFSRAVEIRDESVSRIYVSGTASINERGETVHIGNPEEQIRHTLRVVKELLSWRHHSLGDAAHCVAFVKSPDYAPAFRRIAEEEGLDPRGVIETAADICRDDLLFELEVMTIKPLSEE